MDKEELYYYLRASHPLIDKLEGMGLARFLQRDLVGTTVWFKIPRSMFGALSAA